MLILTVYKSVIASAPALVPAGSIFIARVDQNAKPPNVLLEMPESGQDYSHQGPVGLFDAHLMITARAETDRAAFELGEAIARRLQSWTGTLFDCRVQLTEHFKSSGGYDDKAKLFTQTEEFTAWFTRIA